MTSTRVHTHTHKHMANMNISWKRTNSTILQMEHTIRLDRGSSTSEDEFRTIRMLTRTWPHSDTKWKRYETTYQAGIGESSNWFMTKRLISPIWSRDLHGAFKIESIIWGMNPGLILWLFLKMVTCKYLALWNLGKKRNQTDSCKNHNSGHLSTDRIEFWQWG